MKLLEDQVSEIASIHFTFHLPTFTILNKSTKSRVRTKVRHLLTTKLETSRFFDCKNLVSDELYFRGLGPYF